MAKHGRDSNSQLQSQSEKASALLADRKVRQSAPGGAGRPDPTPRQDYPKGIGQFIMRNLLYILSVVAVIAVVTLIVVIAAPFSPDDSQRAGADEAGYVSPYDWTKLDRSNSHYAYTVDGEVKSRLGIDVSENQHHIDWDAVAADDIDFAMIRLGYRGATEGDLYLDEQFEDNIVGARDAGLDRGIYFFSQAVSKDEAVEEAEYVLEHLSGERLEYPVAFDSEEKVAGVSKPRTSGLDRDQMTEIAEAFCERIEQEGYSTIIYGNAADLSRFRRTDLERRKIWWAEYGTTVPTAKIDITMWQYSNSGDVDGISGAVDMNLDLTDALSL